MSLEMFWRNILISEGFVTDKFHQINSVHQILIVDGGEIPDSLPPQIVMSMDSVRSLYPASRYQLWSGNDIRNFIVDNFDGAVLDLYDHLVPYAYKADLARYCILKVLGGMYVDLGVRMMGKWDIPARKGIAAFRDVAFVTQSWTAIQNGLLWALPGRPEFDYAIKGMVSNWRSRFYGRDTLHPTGPVLLGRAFCKAMMHKDRQNDMDDQHIGGCRRITPDGQMPNLAYVSKDLKLIALRTKSLDGDLAHLGLKGTNNYNDLWRQRRIYGEKISLWDHRDHSLKVSGISFRDDSSIRVEEGGEGLVTYGPYTSLHTGSYSLRIFFDELSSFESFKLEITADHGATGIAERTYSSLEADNYVEIEFDIDEDVESIEFRTYVGEGFVGGISRFELDRFDLIEGNGGRATGLMKQMCLQKE